MKLFNRTLPESILFLKNSRELKKLLGFEFFIHCNWGALSAVLPFWFEQTKSLENFAYYYSALTFVAGTSFLWTNMVDKLEIKKLSLLLSILYLVRGILLLFPTNVLVSTISGICGGTCIIFYTLISRTWVNNWDNEKEKSHVIGWTNSEFRVANALSVALVGLGLSLLGTKIIGLSTLILITSILPMASHFFIQRSELRITRKPVVPVMYKIAQCFQQHRNLLTWTLVCNFFSGLHIGLITPYFGILLNKIGFNPAVGVTLISVASFLKIICQPIFSTIYQPHKKGGQIFGIGILYALLLCVWGLNLSTDYLVPIVLSTLVMQTAFTFFENNIYYTVFPKDWSLQLFTLGSFLFHLSNIGGNFLGNKMISQWNVQLVIFTGTIIISVSGLLYYLFIQSLNSSKLSTLTSELNHTS